MLEISTTTKIIIAPDQIGTYELIQLTFNERRILLAVTADQLYELNDVGAASKFGNRQEPRLKDGKCVKSLIFESNDPYTKGFVLSSPNFVTLTKFDIMYSVLNWMSCEKGESRRYQPAADIIDEFGNILEDKSVAASLSPFIEKALTQICETIVEGDQFFFRLDRTKAFSLLRERISSLKTVLLENNSFSLLALVQESLTDSPEKFSQDILDLQMTKFSIDLIFESYLTTELKRNFIESAAYDFTPLSLFITASDNHKRALAIVDANHAANGTRLEQRKGQVKRNSAAIDKKANGKGKRAAQKVAVGKGVLDSFFKRGK